jgi:hypothetical protein
MRSRGIAGDYPRERVRNHSLAFGAALSAMRRSMTDFRTVNGGPHASGAQNGRAPLDERLRGLAPKLDLAPLVAPSSPWQTGR